MIPLITSIVGEVWGFVGNLFNTDGFPARWDCGPAWQKEPGVGWLHIGSDIAIFGAYLAIPVLLAWFVTRRRDFPFPSLVILFALFIVSCGIVHLVEAVIFWEPVYRLSGFLKLITAAVSWGTVVVLVPVIPRVLNLPNLEKVNSRLEAEVKERRRAESQLLTYTCQLERSNQELDEFAYITSHDLRSPLQAVKNLANWIRDDNRETLTEESTRHIELMHQRIGRMECLLDDLQKYSRIGRVEQSIQPTDVGAVLAGIVESLPRSDQMKIKIGSDMPVLTTFKSPLELVLRKLIENAIKHHNRNDGQILITCRESGEYFLFQVRDDGPGISPEFHTRIFKVFETLRPRDDVEGSGMGLSIARKTVETVDGEIWLESELGKGAAFCFSWPKTVIGGEA